MNEIINSKKTLVYIIIGLVILAGSFGIYYFQFRPKTTSEIDIRKFSGSVVNIKDDTVHLKGVYGFDEKLPPDLSAQRDFSFKVGSATTFKKLEIRMPSWEELTATGKTKGSYNLKDLPRTEGIGSLNDLKNSLSKGDISIKAEFLNSIANANDPVASSVFNTILVKSPLPQPPKTQ